MMIVSEDCEWEDDPENKWTVEWLERLEEKSRNHQGMN